MAGGGQVGVLPLALLALLPAAFVAFWVLVIALIARAGWARLADEYAATGDPPSGAKRLYWQSLSVGTGLLAPNYSGCINAWITAEALYLRPALFFRPFHPMLRLRWAEMASVERHGRLLSRHMRVVLRGDAPALGLAGRLGIAVQEAWQRHAAGVNNRTRA